jgi:hypothetical protein
MAKTDRLGPLAAVVGLLAAVGLLIVLMMLVFEVKPAKATFPGKNGRIAYERNIFELYTINPDGSAKTKITNTGVSPSLGDYSPTGKKITYRGHHND